ncbi:unnamed protein product [Didymodactylos carnosus]|uniref:Uncharacterized protein n=1 Tax=Didymodactylos carnosus TaxID=1234261 RepID=A0A8S2LQ92_9BILA|nr:unnamed protein product [Didymodactylos carnosus]CAF3917645.1 unnamed protein product [Didymodactylos carnosus]
MILRIIQKYSFKCGQYRKYPLCRYELKATVPDDDPKSITVMFKDAHNHGDRNQTSRAPSPVRQSVSKYVGIGLTEAQIRSSVSIDHPSTPVLIVYCTLFINKNLENLVIKSIFFWWSFVSKSFW